MSNEKIPFEDYKECFILPNTCLLFHTFPSNEDIERLRDLLDGLEQMNSRSLRSCA